jgi:NADH:ubiquinone oxidoreductase subunit E
MSMQPLSSILVGRRSQPHQLIEVLHDVQENYGYISEETMRNISNDLGVPLIEVYRVASFYKAFRLSPYGKNVITICMGTACHIRGATRVLEKLEDELGISSGETTEDKKFSLETVRCIGCCAISPVIKIDQSVYSGVKPNTVMDILMKY